MASMLRRPCKLVGLARARVGLTQGLFRCSSDRFAHSWASLDTPNPEVRKFEWSASGSQRQVNLLSAQEHIQMLDGVRDVFVASGGGADEASAPWVAVTRARGASWETLERRVQEVLEGLPEVSSERTEAEGAAASTDVPSDSIECEIVDVLDNRVRPSVQADGGDVELLRWEATSGRVVLRLRGACRGCPQSAVTLQETILRTLKHFVPEVKSVEAEEEELDPEAASDPFADIKWDHNGEAGAVSVADLAQAGTPIFSTFAGVRAEGPILRRLRFSSHVELAGRKPEHIFVSCVDCKARRTIEDPQDLLRADKGNATGKAAVMLCPTCFVLISA
eukprot:TRINITY_DN69803_c0_g1_i1.p1 TRINITY_DN69803_c0_g1~~TRINITY_DN69803_c0_g1_i1.p1  ORF type:complete len:335 (-),score=46.90 TRINITY_DN69803_c0_g1_i1:33-1037(-)